VTDLEQIARDALDIPGVESAAIFVVRPASADPELELAAAAGIEGPPLDGLVAAVRNTMHPIARALRDDGPTFDDRPMNPGGPALRSHVPLGSRGVLALAHEPPLDAAARATAMELAATAMKLLGG